MRLIICRVPDQIEKKKKKEMIIVPVSRGWFNEVDARQRSRAKAGGEQGSVEHVTQNLSKIYI